MSFPLPTTPLDIIYLALKTANVLGVGQAPEAEDTSDAFNLMNMMMAQWQRRRYLVYQLITTSLQSTGALSYTVGPGGDFNTPRPSKLESAYFRQNQNTPLPVDYPLQILRSREDYNRISIKNLNAFPRYAWYEASYPLGTLYVWPVPNNQYEIFITTMVQLQQFQTPADSIVLPPEYIDALMWNLVMRLYPLYGMPPNPEAAALAKSSLNTIEEANANIPLLQMPTALTGNNTGTYNIYGDFYIGSNP